MKGISGYVILRENAFEKSEDEYEDEKEIWNVHFHTQDTTILADFKSVIEFLYLTRFLSKMLLK